MRARLLFITLVALLAGFGAGLATATLIAPAAPDPRPTPVATDSGTPTENAKATERPEPPSPADKPVEPTPQVAEQPVEKQADAGGVVRGRFLDQTGKPVAGVAVELRIPVTSRPDRPKRPDFSDDESYFEAVMAFHRLNERAALAAWRKAASGADGRFAFNGVGDGNNLLSIRPVGYLLEPGVPDLTRNVLPGDELEFKLFRAIAFRVRAEAPEGERGRIAIEWKRLAPQDGQGSAFVPPNVDTTVYLPAGRYELRAVRGERRGGPVIVGVSDPPPAGAVVLTFAATRGVVGRLVFDGARPLHLSVRVARAQAGLTDEEVAGNREQVSAPMVPFKLAEDGGMALFQWEQTENGDYVVSVHSGYRVVAMKRLALGDGVTEVELRPAAAANQKQVHARVERPTGSAAEKPMFSINYGTLTGNNDVLDVWVASTGEYRIYFQESAAETPRTAKLACTFQMLGTAEAEFRPGYDVDVLLKFDIPASVVFSFKGEVAKHPRVNVSFQGRGGSVSMNPETAPKTGGFQLRPTPMQPGAWRMEVHSTMQRGFPMALRDAELKPGENAIEIDLPELHAVRIDASAHHKERWGISLEQRATGRREGLNPDKDGIALLTNVPPGQYRLVVPARRPEETEVVVNLAVPTGGTVVIPR